ncbi:hypothetical protein [Acidocella aminolytica]|nr:hypothetical protein [Acidocella aminolytica]
MSFAVKRSFWPSDESRGAPDPANPRQCREGIAFHVRFRQQNGTHAAMNSAGDAGRGVGGGLSGE